MVIDRAKILVNSNSLTKLFKFFAFEARELICLYASRNAVRTYVRLKEFNDFITARAYENCNGREARIAVYSY